MGRLSPSPTKTMKKAFAMLKILGFLFPAGLLSAAPQHHSISERDLMAMDFEQLMTLDVSSVERKPQTLAEIAAAVTVLTKEDIRRSGATSVAELMRLVPGFIVTRIDANKWSVSSSEDSNRLSDDLTVLIDGRPTYSSLFGGTFWEHIDIVLQDVERIEVVRGPSGKLWGTNMNRGAVNIITQSSKETQGLLVALGGGSEERGQAVFRYGGALGDDLSFRVYGKAAERDRSWAKEGAADDWRNGQTGFRADWKASDDDEVMLQGNYYYAEAGQRLQVPVLPDAENTRLLTEDAKYSNAYLMTQWQHTLGESSAFQAGFFFDYVRRDELSIHNERDRYGFDLSHYFMLPWDQKILWGFSYRNERDRTGAGHIFSLQPANRTLETYIGYLQDEISFFDDRFRLAFGSSVVKNTYIEEPLFQPNVHAAWMPTKQHTVWAAITRTYRTPYRLEKEGQHWLEPDQDNTFEADREWVKLLGNSRQKSEKSTGFQIGYRGQIDENFSLDMTAYLITERSSPAQKVSADGKSLVFQNRGGEDIYGVQLAADWRFQDWWSLKPAASYMYIDELGDEGTNGSGSENPEFLEEAGWPSYQVSLRSLMDLGRNWELDTTFRYVDALRGAQVKGYFNLDARLGWRPSRQWEISVVGHNLLQSHHDEARSSFFPTQSTEIQRGVYALITWRY